MERTTSGLQNPTVYKTLSYERAVFFVPTCGIVDQTLAAVANLKTNVAKAQLPRSQCGCVTNRCGQFRAVSFDDRVRRAAVDRLVCQNARTSTNSPARDSRCSTARWAASHDARLWYA